MTSYVVVGRISSTHDCMSPGRRTPLKKCTKKTSTKGYLWTPCVGGGRSRFPVMLLMALYCALVILSSTTHSLGTVMATSSPKSHCTVQFWSTTSKHRVWQYNPASQARSRNAVIDFHMSSGIMICEITNLRRSCTWASGSSISNGSEAHSSKAIVSVSSGKIPSGMLTSPVVSSVVSWYLRRTGTGSWGPRSSFLELRPGCTAEGPIWCAWRQAQ